MTDNKLFAFGTGQPTKPEIEELLTAFPPDTMTVGWEATDEEIAAVLELDPLSHRFRTVCNAWRRALERDHRLQPKRRKNTGYYRPTSTEVLQDTKGVLRHSEHSLRKQGRHVSIIKPVSELETSQQQHQLRLTGARILDLRKARMNILPSTVASAVPKLEPPAAAKKS